LAHDYFSSPNMGYASGGDHLHHIQAKQQHAELQVVLIDHNLGIDMI
jgi:hypothetical protein